MSSVAQSINSNHKLNIELLLNTVLIPLLSDIRGKNDTKSKTITSLVNWLKDRNFLTVKKKQVVTSIPIENNNIDYGIIMAILTTFRSTLKDTRTQQNIVYVLIGKLHDIIWKHLEIYADQDNKITQVLYDAFLGSKLRTKTFNFNEILFKQFFDTSIDFGGDEPYKFPEEYGDFVFEQIFSSIGKLNGNDKLLRNYADITNKKSDLRKLSENFSEDMEKSTLISFLMQIIKISDITEETTKEKEIDVVNLSKTIDDLEMFLKTSKPINKEISWLIDEIVYNSENPVYYFSMKSLNFGQTKDFDKEFTSIISYKKDEADRIIKVDGTKPRDPQGSWYSQDLKLKVQQEIPEELIKSVQKNGVDDNLRSQMLQKLVFFITTPNLAKDETTVNFIIRGCEFKNDTNPDNTIKKDLSQSLGASLIREIFKRRLTLDISFLLNDIFNKVENPIWRFSSEANSRTTLQLMFSTGNADLDTPSKSCMIDLTGIGKKWTTDDLTEALNDVKSYGGTMKNFIKGTNNSLKRLFKFSNATTTIKNDILFPRLKSLENYRQSNRNLLGGDLTLLDLVFFYPFYYYSQPKLYEQFNTDQAKLTEHIIASIVDGLNLINELIKNIDNIKIAENLAEKRKKEKENVQKKKILLSNFESLNDDDIPIDFFEQVTTRKQIQIKDETKITFGVFKDTFIKNMTQLVKSDQIIRDNPITLKANVFKNDAKKVIETPLRQLTKDQSINFMTLPKRIFNLNKNDKNGDITRYLKPLIDELEKIEADSDIKKADLSKKLKDTQDELSKYLKSLSDPKPHFLYALNELITMIKEASTSEEKRIERLNLFKSFERTYESTSNQIKKKEKLDSKDLEKLIRFIKLLDIKGVTLEGTDFREENYIDTEEDVAIKARSNEDTSNKEIANEIIRRGNFYEAKKTKDIELEKALSDDLKEIDGVFKPFDDSDHLKLMNSDPTSRKDFIRVLRRDTLRSRMKSFVNNETFDKRINTVLKALFNRNFNENDADTLSVEFGKETTKNLNSIRQLYRLIIKYFTNKEVLYKKGQEIVGIDQFGNLKSNTNDIVTKDSGNITKDLLTDKKTVNFYDIMSKDNADISNQVNIVTLYKLIITLDDYITSDIELADREEGPRSQLKGLIASQIDIKRDDTIKKERKELYFGVYESAIDAYNSIRPSSLLINAIRQFLNDLINKDIKNSELISLLNNGILANTKNEKEEQEILSFLYILLRKTIESTAQQSELNQTRFLDDGDMDEPLFYDKGDIVVEFAQDENDIPLSKKLKRYVVSKDNAATVFVDGFGNKIDATRVILERTYIKSKTVKNTDIIQLINRKRDVGFFRGLFGRLLSLSKLNKKNKKFYRINYNLSRFDHVYKRNEDKIFYY